MASKINKLNKLYKSLSKTKKHTKAQGVMLVLDPSCGSQSSMPGYALFVRGILIEKGFIPIPLGKPLYKRLMFLGEWVRDNLPRDPDLLVIEAIPTAKGRFSDKGLASLFQSVGAIVSQFNQDAVVFVSPQTWWANAPEGYVKSDAGDAEQMGNTVLRYSVAVAESKIKKAG